MANAKKVALITGANKGLGLEMARQLGKAGVTVVMGARDPQKGEAAAEALRKEGIDARFLKLDVTNRQDQAAAAKVSPAELWQARYPHQQRRDQHGSARLRPGKRDAVLQRTFDTNFFAPVALARVLLPLLKKSEAGRIVNMPSILGSQTLQSDPNSPHLQFQDFRL